MPLIRKAIEKRRRHFITLLMNTGLFKQLDLESLTLTELELEYKRYSERRNEEYE
ncbi:Fur-regulated basic protein FbpA [Bacillus dakarensis]|uniref:Fur-regulated basic protein FbpA n=1 Tax=Robertmurraya dakarensis TaxID=1926278 RepID=UPI0011159A73|nr:Fur-regulated basic protein FbpA [Bacillus dakarensis]